MCLPYPIKPSREGEGGESETEKWGRWSVLGLQGVENGWFSMRKSGREGGSLREPPINAWKCGTKGGLM